MESIHGIPGESPPKFDGYFGMQRNAVPPSKRETITSKKRKRWLPASYHIRLSSQIN